MKVILVGSLIMVCVLLNPNKPDTVSIQMGNTPSQELMSEDSSTDGMTLCCDNGKIGIWVQNPDDCMNGDPCRIRQGATVLFKKTNSRPGSFCEFIDCMSGPYGTYTPQCAIFDYDGDEDVDLRDYCSFVLRFH